METSYCKIKSCKDYFYLVIIRPTDKNTHNIKTNDRKQAYQYQPFSDNLVTFSGR